MMTCTRQWNSIG